jgi:tetratricopeptide (TPR) repeat protein
MEVLGMHLYSSQELAYVIFNHPLLVMDDFIDDSLLDFMRDELNMGFLALRIERYLRGGGSSDEALAMILSESDYYSTGEIGKFRQLLHNFRTRHPAEFGKVKGDELFSLRQYGRAGEIYRELLDTPRDGVVNDAFLGKIWYNLGSCYARMCRFDKALDAYEHSYTHSSQKNALEQMVLLTMLDDRLTLSDRMRAFVDDELKARCEERFATACANAEQSDRVREIDALFEHDKIKRREGQKRLIEQWKNDYRFQV